MKRSLLSLVLVVLGAAGFAQTGPGGVGNTLGVGQPRNVIWLDASTLSLGQGADILSWPDLSGNANTFSTTAAFSPVFENVAQQNGLGYAKFSKSNNRIVKTSLTDMPQSAYTVVIVYRTTDTNDGLVSYAISDARPDEYLLRNSDALRTYLIDGVFDQTTLATNNNTFRSLVTSWENVDGILDYYINGNESGASTRTVTGFKLGQNITAGGTMAIGNDQDLLNGDYDPADAFQGDIAEVIVYDRKLNLMQVRAVNNYIAAKYNLALSNVSYVGSTPANGDYDRRVIGVGRLSNTTHMEGNSAGFILTVNALGGSPATTFAFAGHNNVANSAVATNLGAGVQQRWNRSWYVDFTGNLTVDATFDLGDGIGGGSPVNKDNYVLLKLVGGVWTDQGVASANKTINGDRISFRVTQAAGDGQYTLGTLDAAVSPVAGINIRTWYSYQTGQWNNPDVWTLDGGVVPLLTNPANETPQFNDNVVITNGRTVTMNVNTITVAGMRVDGTLNVASSSGHNFNAIEGNGRIRLSGSGPAPFADNFPAGTTTNFADPINGGTVEYYGSNSITLGQARTYNNLEIKLTGGATSAFLMSNFVVNGYMSVETGTFQFNNAASTANRTLTVGSDVTIQSGASITVGAAGGIHEFNLSGDLVNNGGTLALTNYTVADYTTATPTNGAVNANFVSGLRNQELTCNGFSKFWRIKIDKGSDDTYKLRITTTSVGNFNLWGYANEGHGATAQLTNNLNALGLVRGTVEIGTNVEVNKLGTSNYNISEGATLWVNGGTVIMPAAGGGNATVVYGKARVTTGIFNSLVPSGFTLRVNGTLEVEGGSVQANQIRTSILGTSNIGGYIQTGGTVVVNGTAGTNTDYHTFSMTYPGNVFRMSGGTLTVRRASSTAARGILFINSDPQNVSVTGGTITLELDNNSTNYNITSRAALWNLILRKTVNNTQTFKVTGGTSGDAGTGTDATLAAQPLVVLNSLTIDNTPFNATLDAMGNDVELGKDFFINTGATYTTGTNTTKFTGTANGILNLGATARTFNSIYFEKTTTTASLDIQNGVAAPTASVTANGTFSAIRGVLSYGAFVISAKGNVVNNSTVGLTGNTGKVILDGTVAQTISSNNGTFWNLELSNTAGINLTTGTLNVARTLTMTNGVFNIGINKLTLLGATASIAGTGFGTTKMIQTAGNSSDGGLELFFTGTGAKTYPIGTNANATVRYTPAVAHIVAFTSTGYIQINPADEILATTNNAGGADILSYYWRVRSRDFTTAPTVSYNFNYADSDIGGNEALYVPGRVLDTNPFTRSTDGATDDVNAAGNVVFFNGASTASAFPGSGSALVAASYTAGVPARFTGAPTVYYSRNAAGNGSPTGFPGPSWHDGTTWSLTSHTGAAAGAFPQAGDVAIIGSGNTGANNYHAVNITSANAAAAQVVYAVVPAGTYEPRITVQANRSVNFGRVGGAGTFMVRVNTTNIPTIVGDFGDFSNENSTYNYYSESGSLITLPTNPVVFPNLRFEGGNTGSFNRRMAIPAEITVKRSLIVNQQASFVLGGNATVAQNVNLSDNTPGRIEFPTTGGPYTLTITGNLNMNAAAAGTNSIIVGNTTPSGLLHKLSIAGNITVANGVIDLFNANGGSDNNALLEFTGSTSTTFSNTGGGAMDLYRISVDKGTSIATTQTISSAFTLGAPSNILTKPLTLVDGLLILDNAGTTFNLTSGGGDFIIPATAGLELRQGQVNVSGTNTGILLDGLLRVAGGIVNMDDAVNGGNNYIEYSASGSATLEVSSGGLVVGSQIRRGLTSTAGILRYNQSGGSVTVAKNAAPQTNRGVFEIVNANSRFLYSAGSLTIVQGINSAFVPSILIEPSGVGNYNFPVAQTLTIGNINTPNSLNAKNIGIKTNQIFGALTIDNSSNNDPVVKLYTQPLTLGGIFTINNGATFNAQGFDVTVRHNWVNNGSYLSSLNKTIFSPAGASIRTISGTGQFDIYKLDKVGTTQTTLATSLVVNNELRVLAGTIATATNFLVAKQNVVFDAAMTSSSGLGLVFEGTAKQTLSRTENLTTSTLSIVTIRNSNGVEIPDGQGYKFSISGQLRLESGVFDVGGNLLLLTTAAIITPVNPFSVGNMIRTNSSFSDSGIRKFFPVNYTTDFVFPVGQARYTPITFNFGSPGKTTGTGTPTITIRTAEEPHPSVVEDAEVPSIVDVNNVLQYYYTIDADNIATSFNADAIMNYDNAYVAVTTPYTVNDYITARIRSDNNPAANIDKSSGVINTTQRTLTFSFSGVTDEQISGDYFAGIDDAIPSNVPIYTTVRNGDINDPGTFGSPVGLTGAPTGAIVVVSTGHELDFNQNSVRLYKTIINSGSVLDIAGTYGHRLGTVTGTGTLKITSDTESAVMPAGFFEDFFGCSGGSLEYSGTGSYDILGGITDVRNLTLSNSGSRLLANNDLHICNDFIVTGPTFLNTNNRAIVIDRDLNLIAGSFNKSNGNRTLTVKRDLNVTGGTFVSVSGGDRIVNRDVNLSSGTFNVGTGGILRMNGGNLVMTGGTFNGGSSTVRILMNGTITQAINGNFTGAAQIHRLELDNSFGLNLLGNVDINTELILTNGLINPATNVFKLNTNATVSPVNGRANSFVNGRLYKDLNSAGTFSFPIGKVNRWRYAKVINTTAGPLTWYAEYFSGNARLLEPGVTNQTSSDPSVLIVSGSEYWKVGDNAGVTASPQIGLSWGIESDVSSNASNRESLKVMAWNGTLWDNLGGINFLAGHTQSQGDFTSATTLGFPSTFKDKILTLGTTNLANPLPVELEDFSATLTKYNTVSLKWRTESETNNDRFEIERSQNGVDFEYLGQVRGAGTTNVARDYAAIDENPLYGSSYYRLKQVDFDGTFSYSDIEKVINDATAPFVTERFMAHPNPVELNKTTVVTFNKVVDITIYNNMNRVVRQYRGIDSFDATGMQGGLYIIRTSKGEVFKLLIK